MPCDVIIGKGALNFPCELPERGHDGPHATPSILASVQARQAWEAQQAQRQAQPGPGLPYQNYEQFQPGTQKPHPRQMVKCFFCSGEVVYEEFYGHIGTHVANPPAMAMPAPQTGFWQPQGPPPGTPAPEPTGVVGASSAQALADHIAQHQRSPVMEQAAHMAEVMDYGPPQDHIQPIPEAMSGTYRIWPEQQTSLFDDIQHLLNRHSRENASMTPDFILAQYLQDALAAYERAVISRDSWAQMTQPQNGQPTG
jgi:hypothetical protein